MNFLTLEKYFQESIFYPYFPFSFEAYILELCYIYFSYNPSEPDICTRCSLKFTSDFLKQSTSISPNKTSVFCFNKLGRFFGS